MGRCGKGKRWSVRKQACVVRRGLFKFTGKKSGVLGRANVPKEEKKPKSDYDGPTKSKNPRFL